MTPVSEDKEIRWLGSSYVDLLAFPRSPRQDVGFQLGKIQAGLEASSWKPFNEIGAGTREISISDAVGIFRVMYVAHFDDAIYVLHCFQKKSLLTTKRDKGIAKARYGAIASTRSSTKAKENR